MTRKMVIGISGASGVIYGIRMLEVLGQSGVETHLILTEAAKENIRIETGYDPAEVAALASHCYDNADLCAPPASGSFLNEGMVVVPCSIKTLSGIAHSYSDNLLIRSADVMLKEKRKLVLVVRETPLHLGHIRLLETAAECGAHIFPPVPSFYHRPKTIEDLIDQTIGKILDYFGIGHNLFRRWNGAEEETPRGGRIKLL